MKYSIRVYRPHFPPPNKGFKLIREDKPFWESINNNAEEAIEIIDLLSKQNISCEVSPKSPFEDESISYKVVKQPKIKVIFPKS